MASAQNFENIVTEIATNPPSSLGKTAPNFDVLKQKNWMNDKPQDPRKSARTLAYLAGYISVAGSNTFAATGIMLEDRTLYLDKNIVSDLLHAEFVRLKNGQFSVTKLGQEYLTKNGIDTAVSLKKGKATLSIWRQYREILCSMQSSLMSEYEALADLGTVKYLKGRGLSVNSKSETYFFNYHGDYVDMKAPVRVVLANVERPSSFQSADIYRALRSLGYSVVHDQSASGDLPLAGKNKEKEASRYSVLARPQQTKFRKSVSHLFSHKCWVTSCEIPQALEAAHITPYAQSVDDPMCDHVSNGLLLRRDIHALYDAGLLNFKPEKVAGLFTVQVDKPAASNEYSKLQGKKISYPVSKTSEEAERRLLRRYDKKL